MFAGHTVAVPLMLALFHRLIVMSCRRCGNQGLCDLSDDLSGKRQPFIESFLSLSDCLSDSGNRLGH